MFASIALATAALFSSLNPKSVAEALAYYELYPNSVEGKKALERARILLNASSEQTILFLPEQINRLKGVSKLSKEDITHIETLASHLPNRKLKGYLAQTEGEIIALPSEEIDLGKALILSQLGSEIEARSYSAMLDLMALQILAYLPQNASPFEKIQAMNRFIFDQMHFRFPPHSAYAENIDRYTFLPSVMDNHLGVCLGVTAMYLAIAQRLDLPLEIITPPGHIYARFRSGETQINIETTARGVHTEDETYLSIQNSTLQERTLKEVIGMTHVNLASTYLYKGEFAKAAHAYEKAKPYMPDDPMVRELLGYSYLFTNRKEEGETLLKGLEKSTHGVAQDYLAGKVDLAGIEAAFAHVDETRDSLVQKQKQLEKILEKFPEFKDGLHQLAITWIQLGRSREAIQALLRYHALDKEDAVTNYYLAELFAERFDFKSCWHYLKQATAACQKENYLPQALKDLRRNLLQVCPE